MPMDARTLARLERTDPAYAARLREAEALRDAFAAEHGATEIRWSSHNLARLLRSTGERPERVAEMKAVLGALGMGGPGGLIGIGGVFDHGEMWSRGGGPWAIVGHPYAIREEHHLMLDDLGRVAPALRVLVDDRPSYYGFGTHHVRIEVPNPVAPWQLSRATTAAGD